MTFAKSPKHFAAKEEKLRKKNLPYQRKKTKARYRKNFYLKRALKKIQPNAPIERTSIERTLRKKAERKSHRKRYNSMAYFKRKAKKPVSLGTPEKRKRLTDVFNFNPELVYDMDRFEVNFIFYI